jgi:hypothetical protein
MMLATSRVFGAFVVGAVLLVTGCSSGGGKQSTPTTKATTSTSAPTVKPASAAQLAKRAQQRALYEGKLAKAAQLRALHQRSWMQECATMYRESAVRTACIAAARNGISPAAFRRKQGP